MKKIIALMLTLCLIFACIPVAFATDECDCGFNPVIYVAALGSASVIKDAGTEDEITLFRPDTEYVISKAVEYILPVVPALLVEEDFDAFGDALIGFVDEAFGDLALDNNGNSAENVSADTDLEVPTSSDHGLEHSFYFNYDFRLDPYEHADRLNECIQQIKELTGHSKVQLKASSMGGVVSMAYFERYGFNDVETMIFQCCPIKGTAVAGELFTGKVEINKNALINYATDAIPNLENDFFQGVLLCLVDVFEALGVWEFLVDKADIIVEKLQGRVYDEALIPIFSAMPGIWSFVPDEYYEDAKEFMLNDEQQGVEAKIDAYHYNVQNEAENILHAAVAAGVKTYIVAGYNVQRTPLVTAYMNTSDGTVDTKYASVGAICADYGTSFESGYTQKINDGHDHLSDDMMIDASTCALPEYTWFVKDMLHSTTHDGHGEMYDWMLTSDTQLDVHSNEKYPQFMQNHVASQTFSEVTEEKSAFEEFTSEMSFTTFCRLLVSILQWLRGIFNR